MIDPVVARLHEGNARAALTSAFAGHPLNDRIAPRIPNLVAQLGTLYEVYGPISECEQAQRGSVGAMVVTFVYDCQHENDVSRWSFQLVRAKSGYVLSTSNFADPWGERS